MGNSLLDFSSGEKVILSEESTINYLNFYGSNGYGNELDKKVF